MFGNSRLINHLKVTNREDNGNFTIKLPSILFFKDEEEITIEVSGTGTEYKSV